MKKINIAFVATILLLGLSTAYSQSPIPPSQNAQLIKRVKSVLETRREALDRISASKNQAETVEPQAPAVEPAPADTLAENLDTTYFRACLEAFKSPRGTDTVEFSAPMFGEAIYKPNGRQAFRILSYDSSTGDISDIATYNDYSRVLDGDYIYDYLPNLKGHIYAMDVYNYDDMGGSYFSYLIIKRFRQIGDSIFSVTMKYTPSTDDLEAKNSNMTMVSCSKITVF
jgi:hypothetical protein